MAPKPENPITDLTDLLGRTAKSIYTNVENSWYAWSGRQRGFVPQSPAMQTTTMIGRGVAQGALETTGAGASFALLDDAIQGDLEAKNVKAAALAATAYALPSVIGYGVSKTLPYAARRLARGALDIDLSDYVLHGGPPPEKLVGGVLDPDYVRGGALQTSPSKINQPSVAAGPNQVERNYITSKFDEMTRIVEQGGDPKRVADAQKYLDEHGEIVRRILAGEEHQTGVHYLQPGMAYSYEGGTYVVKVPKGLKTMDTPAPGGEVKFWGKQTPKGFVPFKTNVASGIDPNRDIPIIQELVDVANQSAGNTLKGVLAKAAGVKVTPAYKQYVLDMFDSMLGREMYPMYRNPNYEKDIANGRFALEFFADYESKPIKMLKNYDEIVKSVKESKTQRDVIRALQDAIPEEQLDSYLNSTLNKTSFSREMAKIKNVASQLAGEKKIPRK